MSHRTSALDDARKDEIYHCLTHHRRRRVLAAVADRDTPVDDTDLARRIAAAESPAETSDDRDEIEPILIDLRHAHVPMLDEAGLVEWDREAGTIARADHPAFDDAEVATHLERLDASWDAFVEALARPRRRHVLSIASQRNRIETDALARSVAERDDVSVEAVRVELHHRHLPALDDAGLVAYDRDAETVAFRGHPAVEDDWFAGETASDGPGLVGVSP